jgi:hypothetical protein
MSGPSKYNKPKVYRPEPTQHNDGLEHNIDGISEQICSRPPQPPCTIQLIMDHDIPQDSDMDEFEFELVRTFTLCCLKTLFGAGVNPVKLTKHDLEKLNAYVNSIGYNLVTSVEENDTSYKFKVEFTRYGQSKRPEPNPFDHLKKYMGK